MTILGDLVGFNWFVFSLFFCDFTPFIWCYINSVSSSYRSELYHISPIKGTENWAKLLLNFI